MSNYYNHGPPPPPYQAQAQSLYPHLEPNQPQSQPSQPTQQPSSYTYMPVPVMLPAYQPQPENPTYVTNYIVQPQPPPAPAPQPLHIPPEQNYVRVINELIDWIPATPTIAHNFTSRAVVGGHEGWDFSPLWVIRAHSGGDLIPGKLAIKHRSPYVAHAGKEIFVNNFEVLVAKPNTVRWIPSSHGQVPANAIIGGNTLSGEPLYIGRTRHRFSLTPGKVHPSHGCCYISYAGEEISHKFYEVLCKVY